MSKSRHKARPTHAVITHPGADDGLRDIAYYIAVVRREPWNATRFVVDFDRHIASLDANPDFHQRVSDAPPRPVYERVFKKSYLVYHEIFDAERVVRVL